MRRHKCWLAVVLLGLAWGDPAAAQDAGALLGTLQAQLRSGQLAAARETARRYVVLDDANPLVWYNLAGLEEQAGDRPAAVAALRRAAATGFDDFRAAADDADLAGLRDDPAFAALRDAAQATLRERSRSGEIPLPAGAWSPWQDLDQRDPHVTAALSRVRLRCTGVHLEVEAEIHDSNPRDVLPPWQGGAGLVVAVTAPDADAADGARFREVALGLQQKLPVGALLVGHWQPLVELAPRLRYDPASRGLIYQAQIPWSALAPFDPLLDDRLLVNVTYLSLRPQGGRDDASLLRDPAAGRADARWRRGVPLRVTWPPQVGPLLRLRPADAVMAPGPGRVAAVLVAPQAGAASWSSAEPFAGRGRADLRAGRQELAVVVPIPDRIGPSPLALTVTLPGDTSLTATTEVLVLPPTWPATARRRLTAVPAAERAGVVARLDAIAQELRERHPRDPVGPLASTVAEVDALLARAEASGTTLPAAGPHLAIIPTAAGGPPLRCAVQIPAGFARDGEHRLLLLFQHAPGLEARGADLALRALAEMAPQLGVDPARVAVVIPVASGTMPPDADQAAAVIAATIGWARAVLPAVPIALAGVDAFATPVLQASLDPPAGLAGVLLVTGAGFTPWPGADDLALRAILADADRDLAYGWIRFPEETGPDDRALDVIRALRDLGLSLRGVQEVPGELGASQAWGRAAIWAAGLP